MKKILFLIALGSIALAACSSKQCRCYDYTGNRWTGPNTTAAVAGTPCADLNTSTRKCNEMDDPILDPNDIAVGKKK